MEACIRCGECVAVCPHGALQNKHFEFSDFQPISSLQRDVDPVAYVMRTRRSVRAFREQAVPLADLKALFDVVRYAPTNRNSQELWWIVTTGRSETKAFADLARTWMRRSYWPDAPDSYWQEDDDPVLRGAPHLALCCAPADSKWGYTNAAIALTHLDLLAASRGIGACWAGVFMRAVDDWPPLAEAVNLPPGQKIFGALFLGYPKFPFSFVPPRKPSAVDWR